MNKKEEPGGNPDLKHAVRLEAVTKKLREAWQLAEKLEPQPIERRGSTKDFRDYLTGSLWAMTDLTEKEAQWYRDNAQ